MEAKCYNFKKKGVKPVKIAKIISMMLALIVLSEVVLPSDYSLSRQTFASSLTPTQVARENEGAENLSDDIDYWNDGNPDRSFARQIRIATNYANRQYAEGNGIGGSVASHDSSYYTNLKMSNIGVFFGYTEGEVDDDELSSADGGSASKGETKASTVYSRELLKTVTGGHVATGSTFSDAYAYYSYGLLLNLTGLDEVGLQTGTATRKLYGTLAQVSYFAASSVNTIFETCFKFLWATNPFMFFKDINTSADGSAELENIFDKSTTAMGDSTTNAAGAVGTLAAFFGKIFNVFTDFAWTVSIPLSLLFIIIVFFMTRRGRMQLGTNIKKLLVKVVFIAIGIPLLGSAYTQVLDGMRLAQSKTDSVLAQSVAYTFVDFRRWVETSRLAPVSAGNDISLGIILDSNDDAMVSSKTIFNLRKICYEINKQSGLFGSMNDDKLIISQTGAMLKDFIYDTTAHAAMSTNNTGVANSTGGNKKEVESLLRDYKEGTVYSATSFENGSVAWMEKQSARSNITFGQMLLLSSDKYAFSQKALRKLHSLGAEFDSGGIKFDPTDKSQTSTYGTVALARFNGTNFAGIGYNIWNNGGIEYTRMTHAGTELIPGITSSSGMKFTNSGSSDTGYNCGAVGGLSTMSMYTYLTSEFTQAGITTYGNSPTVHTHRFHYAVNLIGSSSIMQLAFLLNMLAMMLGYFFLAISFVFRTAFDILFKGFQFMGHALLAAAGFYKSIGTCICMVVNMIAQLFITVVFFSLMSDFMFMVSSLLDNLFGSIVSGVFGMPIGNANAANFGANYSYFSEIMVIISSFLSAFVITFFVCFATKWRSAIMASISSMIEELVGTLLGVNLNGASTGVMGNMAGGAFATASKIALGAGVVGGAASTVTGAMDGISENMSGVDALTEDEENAKILMSSVDGSVNPTEGASFDGGKAALEEELENKEEGMDVLENGLEERDEQSSTGDSGSFEDENGMTADSETTDEAETSASDTLERKTPARELDAQSSEESNADVLARNDSANTLKRNSNPASAQQSNKSEANKSVNLAKTGGAAAAAVATAGGSVSSTTSSAGTISASVSNASSSASSTETTAPKSGMSFDPARGIVMTSVGDDGTVSDFAIGANGVSIGSVDADGNKTVSTVNKGGMQISKTGSDGSSEVTTTTFDGFNSSVSVAKTDANGNSETITNGLNGSTVQRVETSDDGSVTTTTTNADGTSTVDVSNAETGYHSSTAVAADGSSVQIETTASGVETVTNTNASGVVTSKVSTSTGANGQKNVTSYTLNDDGSTVKSVQTGGTKTVTTQRTDGSSSETQSVVLSNGTISETTTSYSANGTQIGDTSTVIKPADGLSTIATGTVTSGTDNIGDYTMSSVTTASGTVETKDYGGGHVVTTETAINGNTAVTEANGKGGYVITETDASTGNVTTTTIEQGRNGVSGKSVTRDADGHVVENERLERGGDGTIRYVNAAGGTFATASIDNNGSVTDMITMSYASGGSNTIATDRMTGNITNTVADGMGSSSVTVTDSKTGAIEVNTTNANGSVVRSVLSGNGDYTETMTQANGGTRNIIRTGTGDSATETVAYSDGAGNTSRVTTQNGQVTYRSGSTSAGNSFVQQINSDGNWVTEQNLSSGDKVNTVVQANGDYERVISYANGASRTETLADGTYNVSTASITGIGTTYSRTSAGVSSTVTLDGVTMSENVNFGTGESVRRVVIDGQTYNVTSNADGSSNASFNLGDGVHGTYKTNADGSATRIIRADGTSRVETVTAAGESTVIYVDNIGNEIVDPETVTHLNGTYAASIDMFNSNAQMIYGTMGNGRTVTGADISGFEVAAPAGTYSMAGMVSSNDAMPQISANMSDDEINQILYNSARDNGNNWFGGLFGEYATLNGGSAQNG